MTDAGEIYFFHGLLSQPVGTKSNYLREHFDVVAPDFQKMGIWERVKKAEELTADKTDLVVVGSSYGGLLAALLYARHPERFRGYVLMAPALHNDEASEIDKMADNAVVIHGINDDVVPIDVVREFCSAHGIVIDEVDDDHRLHDSLDQMVEAIRKVME